MPRQRSPTRRSPDEVVAEAELRTDAVKRLTTLGRERRELLEEAERKKLEIVREVRKARAAVSLDDAGDATGLGKTTIARWLNHHPNVR